VYVLKRLTDDDIQSILRQALVDSERGLAGMELQISDRAIQLITDAADGDARRALNLLEISADLAEGNQVQDEIVSDVVSDGVRRFDKGGEYFYDQISALHKSVRGSSPDASLYWLARMLDGGCDALYIARRVVRMASEDIGNADPRALTLSLNAWETVERLGSPEGELALAQAVVYMACAAKSNAVYKAFNMAMEDARIQGTREVPVHLRNAPTRLMKELGYGHEYRYAHDEPEAYAAGERYFPDDMDERQYYQPVPRGLEQKIAERLAYFRSLDRKARDKR
jgi:putative ATPase